ncbi:MAG: 2-amino-4-hydroxy-6-hydroxymethyldihydropteridine diphosphokinase [Candidatus Omnitrophica bacterium]|nr:2-amino-4-hydroxy-6-hydroxymethyldihydropteridine diphosphokinase [Candidatus Omnitrophota bacterium]
MATALIGLGSNLGDRETLLQQALEEIRRVPRTKLLKVSRLVETEPVGGPPQGKYLNGVAKLSTELPPEELLAALQGIERRLGRPMNRPRWGPRVIDLDLLSYDEAVLQTPSLILPHPKMQERLFVLVPLSEVDPHWKHPVSGKRVEELLRELHHESHSAP